MKPDCAPSHDEPFVISQINRPTTRPASDGLVSPSALPPDSPLRGSFPAGFDQVQANTYVRVGHEEVHLKHLAVSRGARGGWGGVESPHVALSDVKIGPYPTRGKVVVTVPRATQTWEEQRVVAEVSSLP